MTAEQWESDRPELTRENELAMRVWHFCGGWNPALLPMAAEFYQVSDMDLLVTQQLVLRKCVDDRRAAMDAAGA